MTIKEKNKIKTLIMNYNFLSYSGNIKLYDLWTDNISTFGGYKRVKYNNKLKMQFVNTIFPSFLDVWKKERKQLESYYESFSSSIDHKLYKDVNKILKKYYENK